MSALRAFLLLIMSGPVGMEIMTIVFKIRARALPFRGWGRGWGATFTNGAPTALESWLFLILGRKP